MGILTEEERKALKAKQPVLPPESATPTERYHYSMDDLAYIIQRRREALAEKAKETK
jgi:hypothetical protein